MMDASETKPLLLVDGWRHRCVGDAARQGTEAGSQETARPLIADTRAIPAR